VDRGVWGHHAGRGHEHERRVGPLVAPAVAGAGGCAQWITVDDHQGDVHSALGDRSPAEFGAALRAQEAAHAAAQDDSRSAPDNVS
jgi:hypothetical protein